MILACNCDKYFLFAMRIQSLVKIQYTDPICGPGYHTNMTERTNNSMLGPTSGTTYSAAILAYFPISSFRIMFSQAVPEVRQT